MNIMSLPIYWKMNKTMIASAVLIKFDDASAQSKGRFHKNLISNFPKKKMLEKDIFEGPRNFWFSFLGDVFS